MGTAAYTRGSAAIRAQLDAAARPVEFVIMEELNALPRAAHAVTPWGEIQFIAGHGGWWAVCPIKGSGFYHSTLRKAVASYHVEVYAYEGGSWKARPIPRT